MKANNQEKVLAVVAGPYRFYQVLWLYTQYPEYEWSILLLPYGQGKEYINKLHDICDKLGIFQHIYHSEMTGENSFLLEQLHLFIKMAFFYFTGRKKKLMKEILMKQTGGNDFDVAFVGCEYSIIEGAIIGLADEKKVYIFEEGLGDYCPRKKFPSLKWSEIISYVVSRMGFFNPYGYFRLKNTALCIKYTSLPDLLKYKNYKEIRTIFDIKETKQEFEQLINRAYPIGEISLDNYDVILFTTPMNGYVKNDDEYIESLHRLMSKRYSGKKILIKKHPRDKGNYEWNDLEYDFLDAEVPAELYGKFIGNQEIILMSASTSLISLIQKEKNIFIVHFVDVHGNYEKNLLSILNMLKFKEENIIHLSCNERG